MNTGANISVIGSIFEENGFPKLKKCDIKLEGYDGHIMTKHGKWERDGKFLVGDIVLVESSKDSWVEIF